MIRPFTCLCLMFAAGSGLFLYNSKHSAQMLDQETARLVKSAQDSRARAALLRAEYDRLGDPERLKELAGQVLTLVPTDPKQFASLTDLEKRLPAIAPPPALPAPAPAPVPAPVIAAADPAPALPVAAEKPAPEHPAPQALAMVTRPAAPAHPAAAAPPPVIAQVPAAPSAIAPLQPATPAAPKPTPLHPQAESKPPAPRPTLAPVQPSPSPVMVAAARPRPVPPPPTPAVANDISARMMRPQTSDAPVPMVASALGMARTMMSQPIPVRP